MIAGLSTHEKPPVGVWVSLNRVLLTLILVTATGVMLYRFLPERSILQKQNAHLTALRDKVETQKQQLLRSKRVLELINRDPEYLELKAREPLQLQKEGERVYRLDDKAADPASAAKASSRKSK